MKRCKRCDVYIKDDTSICPLCDSVLEGEEPGENTYPELTNEIQKFLLVKKVFYFSMILIGTLSVLINYLNFHGFYWSVIVLAAISYCWFTVSYTVMHRTNLGAKVIFQAVGILLVTLVIDFMTGYKGWSLRYVIPGLLLLADIALVFMMIFDLSRWQGYFMCQLAVCILSLFSVIAAAFGLIDNMSLAIITCVILWLILTATVIFGGKRVKNELKRRFHT